MHQVILEGCTYSFGQRFLRSVQSKLSPAVCKTIPTPGDIPCRKLGQASIEVDPTLQLHLKQRACTGIQTENSWSAWMGKKREYLLVYLRAPLFLAKGTTVSV